MGNVVNGGIIVVGQVMCLDLNNSKQMTKTIKSIQFLVSFVLLQSIATQETIPEIEDSSRQMVLLNETQIKAPLVKNSHLKRKIFGMVCGWGMGCQKLNPSIFEQ